VNLAGYFQKIGNHYLSLPQAGWLVLTQLLEEHCSVLLESSPDVAITDSGYPAHIPASSI
jgi:hypothetical protein